MPAPNRIAVYLTAIAALLGGLAPVVADLDWQSTAGIIAGLAAIATVVRTWLQGWQMFEDRAGVGVPELDEADDVVVPPGLNG